MKRTTFRTASTGTARRLGAGILVMGLALSASAKDGSPSGTAPPPVVKAKPSAKHRFQVGVASWYGEKFQGRKTAGGERFDMNGMTCAHRSLPFGTHLIVSHAGRSVVVRINDRGPAAWTGRSLDVSRGAATALGLIQTGTGKVNVTVLASR